MRLRSSQFVFLLLLLCSVQWTDALAHPLAEVVVGSSCGLAQSLTAPGAGQPSAAQKAVPEGDTRQQVEYPVAALEFARRPRPMRQGAREAAEVASHTGLLRP